MNTKYCFLIGFIVLLSCACSQQKSQEKYLESVIRRLEKIQSATYLERRETWNPYDSDPVYDMQFYINAYDNPQDTTIGASTIEFHADDTTHFRFAYDGKARILVSDEDKKLVIDSFKFNKELPFRLVNPPFYNYSKNIINYMLTTTDSITIEQAESDHANHFKLIIHEDRQVEFFGEAFKIPNPPLNGEDRTSVYEIWIDKKTTLPYKVRREMSHNISQRTVSHSEFNTINIEDFKPSNFFPADYEIGYYRETSTIQKNSSLETTPAPDFILSDTHNNQISLQDIQSEVILLHFTGVGCAPCLLSVPFLKKLHNTYPDEKVSVLSIETWKSKIETMKNYRIKHEFTFPFLKSDDETITNYKIGGVPAFFIIDKNKTIRKIFNGYDENNSDRLIQEFIDELLKE